MAHRSITDQFIHLNSLQEHEKSACMAQWSLEQFKINTGFNSKNLIIQSKSEYVQEQINSLPTIVDETPEALEARRQKVFTDARAILRKSDGIGGS